MIKIIKIFFLISIIHLTFGQDEVIFKKEEGSLDINSAKINATKQLDELEKKQSEEKNLAEKIEEFKKKHPRWTLFYLKYASMNVQFNDRKLNSSNFSLGYRKFDKDIFHGLEIENRKSGEGYKSNGVLFNFGYAPKFKVHKIRPFVALHFGVLDTQDELLNQSANGFASILDLGFHVSKSNPFHVMSGVRIGRNIYDNSNFGSSSNQEFYFMFGFKF